VTRQVLEIVNRSGKPVDANTVASIAGLSYPSAHRYLEFLAKKGSILKTSNNVDGKPGRPRSLYSSVPESRKP
jgi:response regulator of citrate/malate metabolism